MGGARARARPSVSAPLLHLALALSSLAGTSYGACRNFDARMSRVDMDGWAVAGRSSEWVVQDDGRSVAQYVNAPKPGFFMTDDGGLIDYVVVGQMQVASAVQDDDFIGFAVGHNGPLPGGRETAYDTMLFSWGGRRRPFAAHNEEAVLSRIAGEVDFAGGDALTGAPGACLFSRYQHLETDGSASEEDAATRAAREAQRRGIGCYAVRRTYDGDAGGWAMQTTYNFAVLYTRDLVRIRIDGVERLSLSRDELEAYCTSELSSAEAVARCRSWRAGRFALYTLSQNGVRFKDVHMYDVAGDTPSAAVPPAANPDIYTTERGAADQVLPLTVPPGTGILANDFSADLGDLSIVVDGAEVNSTAVVNTPLGGVFVIASDGGFTYTPPTLAYAGGREDTFRYSVVDDGGLASAVVDVTVALPPDDASLSGFDVTWTPAGAPAATWDGLRNGDVVGRVAASGGCGWITSWAFVRGDAEGRFALQIPDDGSDGVLVVAKDAARLRRAYADQVFALTILVHDSFMQAVSEDFNVVVPALACDPPCGPHATCRLATLECRCDTGWYPAGACTVFCPGPGGCPDANETVTPTFVGDTPNDKLFDAPIDVDAVPERNCVVGEVHGECLGWAYVLIPVLMVVVGTAGLYVKSVKEKVPEGKTTEAKTTEMKGCELGQNLLEGLGDA